MLTPPVTGTLGVAFASASLLTQGLAGIQPVDVPGIENTLIYFYDPIDVEQDQLIEGSATLTQSKENRRFMNINLRYS
ncbi:hypothetical protein NC651_017551 [Populus alba x Populus x berolinensis]|nr:hypothetical protein NC651_017551 [Populus alba x Populus x berolinensis]